MRGLDPRSHDEVQRTQALPLCPMSRLMDCRVKSGNDLWMGRPGLMKVAELKGGRTVFKVANNGD